MYDIFSSEQKMQGYGRRDFNTLFLGVKAPPAIIGLSRMLRPSGHILRKKANQLTPALL